MNRPAITVVKHAAHEGLGTFKRLLDEKAVSARVIDAWKAAEATDPAAAASALCRQLADASALIVMGGPMGVYDADRFPFLAAEVAALKTRIERDQPTLGICLGSQLLAAAAGAGVRASGRQEIGWYAVTPTEAGESDPLVGGLDWSAPVFHWHGDTFETSFGETPRGAVHLLASERFAQQGFRIGRRVYGLQFHPEVPEEDLPEWLASEPGLAYGAVSGVASREDILRGGAVHAEAMAGLARTLLERLIDRIWRDTDSD